MLHIASKLALRFLYQSNLTDSKRSKQLVGKQGELSRFLLDQGIGISSIRFFSTKCSISIVFHNLVNEDLRPQNVHRV
jgi:hypothetical protein